MWRIFVSMFMNKNKVSNSLRVFVKSKVCPTVPFEQCKKFKVLVSLRVCVKVTSALAACGCVGVMSVTERCLCSGTRGKAERARGWETREGPARGDPHHVCRVRETTTPTAAPHLAPGGETALASSPEQHPSSTPKQVKKLFYVF
jgi:hypothetical protein